jgi:hypothetical protein
VNKLLYNWFHGRMQWMHFSDPTRMLTREEMDEYVSKNAELDCITSHHFRVFPPAIATFWLDSAQRRANPEHLFGAEMTFRIGHPGFDVPLNVFNGCQTASVCNDLQ